MPTNKAVRYDVALSFATENQEVAQKLYHALVKKKLSVYLYQKENQWAMELNEITQNIYYSHSSTALVILSKDYVRNYWTNKEWDTLLRAKRNRRIKSIFILRLDQSTIRGLGDSTIYQEWNDNSEKLARDIKKQIGSTSNHLKIIITIIALISIASFIVLLLTSG